MRSLVGFLLTSALLLTGPAAFGWSAVPLQDERKIELALARGSEGSPSATFPLSVPGTPLACWWDDVALHVGTNVYAFAALGVRPADGAVVKVSALTDAGRPLQLEVLLKEKAATYRIGDFGVFGNQAVDQKVLMRAPAEGRCRMFLNAVGARSPRFVRDQTRSVGPTADTAFEIVGTAVDSGNLIFNLFDTDGKPLFMAFYPFHDPSVKFAFVALFTDRARQILQMHVDQWIEPGEQYDLAIRFADFQTGEDAGFSATTRLKEGVLRNTVVPFDVKALKGGVYKMLYTLTDAKTGRTVHSDHAFYGKPTDGKFPWTGVTYGAEDTVPPPWTSPNWEDDGFSVWNRDVRFGNGLVNSLVSGGTELLDGPVELVYNGEPVDFDVARVEPHRSFADYRLEARDYPVSVSVRAEFDGFMHFKLNVSGTPASLKLRIPLDRRQVVGFDDCSDPMKKLALPQGKSARQDLDPEKKPWWWIGNGAVGLMGGVVNLHGWHCRDWSKAVRLAADAETCSVEMTFVDTQVASAEPRTVEFYLQPTPAKRKDMAFALTPRSKICTWTGSLAKFFDVKLPGFIDEKRVAAFAEKQAKGTRVFYYSGGRVNSPVQPWWSWWADDWYEHPDPCYFAEEVNFKDRADRDQYVWVTGCLNSRSFFEHKLHSICWFLWNSPFDDLYMDLAGPGRCYNRNHGCTWRDAFGVTHHDRSLLSMRELFKRVYREMKKKNPKANIIGHLQYQRTPSDVFFDRLAMGETYDRFIRSTMSYYDILNPEMMQIQYASRASEVVVNMIPQIDRAMSMYAPYLKKTYDPLGPENDRVNRHATAYFKIHDLEISPQAAPQWSAPDKALAAFGVDRRHYAYYKPNPPVTLSAPGPRVLWCLFEGNGKKMLILLNDTDAACREKVTIDGASDVGKDIFSGKTCDFVSGACELELGPRESAFILFD